MSSSSSSEKDAYKGLCIGSGGAQGLLLLGALQEFHQRGQLNSLTHLAGTSAGSVICYLYSIGYEPLEMLTLFCDPSFSSRFGNMNFLNIPTIHGLYPSSIIRDLLHKATMVKLGRIPTFKDLVSKNKYLIVTGYCMSEEPSKRKVLFSPDLTPEMKVIDAVVLSCGVPFLFQKNVYQGKIYIDGAFNSSIPLDYLQQSLQDEPILCLCLAGHINNIDNLLGYLLEVIYIPIREQDSLSCAKDKTKVIILPDKGGVQSFNFTSDTKAKLDMFSQGSSMIRGPESKEEQLIILTKLLAKDKYFPLK